MAGEAKKEFEALKQLGKADLLEKEKLLRKELFNLRFQRVTGHVENPARFRVVRRSIARVLTLMQTAT